MECEIGCDARSRERPVTLQCLRGVADAGLRALRGFRGEVGRERARRNGDIERRITVCRTKWIGKAARCRESLSEVADNVTRRARDAARYSNYQCAAAGNRDVAA